MARWGLVKKEIRPCINPDNKSQTEGTNFKRNS